MSGPYATFLNPRDPMSGTEWPKSQLLGHSGSLSSPIMITDDNFAEKHKSDIAGWVPDFQDQPKLVVEYVNLHIGP